MLDPSPVAGALELHDDVDGAGNLFIASASNERIRKVSPQGIIETVAGNGTPGLSGDGGPATSAQLNDAPGVAVDSAGNLFIADTNNNRIRRVDGRTGIMTTFAGNGGPVNGFERWNNGKYCGDGGPAFDACLNTPLGLAFDRAGNLI